MSDLMTWVGAVLLGGAGAALGYLAALARRRPVSAAAEPAPAIPFPGAPAFGATLEALTLAIDSRDPAARGHVRRVQGAALALGRRLGMETAALDALRLAALLHDVGKLVVPDHVLCKPGRLSDSEFEKVKRHPMAGVAILAPSGLPDPVLAIIRHHHERFDGSGYPDGLRGAAIPLGARILAVADAFESLTAERAWRERLSPAEAGDLVHSLAGAQFDPEVAGILTRHRDEVLEAMSAGAHAGPSHGAGAEPAALGEDAMAPVADRGGFGELLHRGILPAAVRLEPSAAPPRALAAGPAGALRDAHAAQREVYALYEIAQTLGSSLRLTEVLDLVVSKIAMLVPFRTCVVYQAMPAGDLHARFVAGANAAALRGRRLRLGEGITGWAAQHRSSRFSGSPELDLEGLEVDTVAYSTVAAFPLQHRDELLGVITLYFPGSAPCLDDHVRVMEIIARLASGAMKEGRLAVAEDADGGLIDGVTHLPNERHLRQAFEKAVLQSQQSGQPLSVVEMDLDDFRALDDRFGREAGDRFLMEVGRVLRSHLRERDVLVRLEEDRYGALLPGTGFAAAALLTERLQQAVDGFSLRLEEGGVARAGLSIGIALYPLDGEELDALMQRAALNRTRNKHGRKKAQAAAPNVVPFRPSRD